MRGAGARTGIQQTTSTSGQGQRRIDSDDLRAGGFNYTQDVLIAEHVPYLDAPASEHAKSRWASR
jgi:hypothetical protein